MKRKHLVEGVLSFALMLFIIFPINIFPRNAMFLNFQKILFYHSEKTNEYILVALSTDQSTRCGTFDSRNAHMMIEMKNGEKKFVDNKDITILCPQEAANSIMFRFNIIIENSGAVGRERLEIVQEKLVKFVTDLPPIFEAQVIKFSDNIQLKSGFTRNKKKLIKYINQSKPQGSSALYDTIAFVGEELSEYSTEIPILFSLIFTVGKDTGSKISLEDLKRTIASNFKETSKETSFFALIDITEHFEPELNLDFVKSLNISNWSKDITNLSKAFEDVPYFSMSPPVRYIISKKKDLFRYPIGLPLWLLEELVKGTYVFKIPSIGEVDNIRTIYLIKKIKNGNTKTVQDFIIESKLDEEMNREKIYITALSFIDVVTKSTMVDTLAVELINEAVKKGMDEAKRNNNNLVINETGHSIPNTDARQNELINITFDPNLAKIEKINKIIDELMNPRRVDVIVTGHYIVEAGNPKISIRPLIIVKASQKIVVKNLQFSKKELFCTDPITRKTVLCKGAFDQIAQAVQELFEQL
ncbi:MAG: VWA domain-containing protein [Candidatus Aminicenantes bacterium]|nr:VWA domain-containing protein [Candidatus Aminicenantes bacterium]